MRKWELENLVAEQGESMERAYYAILGGDPRSAREILAEALGLNEGNVIDRKPAGTNAKSEKS